MNVFVERETHLILWQRYAPTFLSVPKLLKIVGTNITIHKMFFFTLFIGLQIFLYGFPQYCKISKFQKLLDRLGITNGVKNKPRITEVKDEDFNRTKIVMANNGVGIKLFQNKQDDLEATFGEKIESITHDSNPGYTKIILSKYHWPKVVKFSSLSSFDLPKDHFILGQSSNGIVTQNINELPHMLIAGTTGSGKSILFKEILVSLLKSSPYLQLYLLDLKGGVEVQDFKDYPNATIVKDMKKAVFTLQLLKDEMDRRFAYLEKNGYREIQPLRDKMDKIVIAIDEASALYMKNFANQEASTLSKRAKELTDSLAKLARAAGIHLILATQKVTKETIDTHIQENISGKFCFKTNTLQGSVTVLGNGAAYSLPDIPGRGIWSLGNKLIEIQAPLITSAEIKEFGQQLVEEFKNGGRKMLQPKITLTQSQNENHLLPEGDVCTKKTRKIF
ncbi:MAG: hypothetical protein HQK49_17070 [Oligoflexia bacterium]|nr:hypothetical protein [Oligoflexia bacterium]